MRSRPMPLEIIRTSVRHEMNRQTGCIRGYNRPGLAMLLDALEKIPFDLEILGDGFDNPIHFSAPSQIVVEISNGDKAGGFGREKSCRTSLLRRFQSSANYAISHRRLFERQALRSFLGSQFARDDIEQVARNSSIREMRRDARTHSSGAKDRGFFDAFFHFSHPRQCRRLQNRYATANGKSKHPRFELHCQIKQKSRCPQQENGLAPPCAACVLSRTAARASVHASGWRSAAASREGSPISAFFVSSRKKEFRSIALPGRALARSLAQPMRAAPLSTTWNARDPKPASAVSRMGMASNERLEDFLRKFTTTRYFEELKIPFAIVATDIVRGESVYFTTGEIGIALRASSAYPGLFFPVEYRGRFLVDGFLTDAVPTRAVRELGANIAIGIYLEPGELKDKPRNTIEVIGRAFSIIQETQDPPWRHAADVVIEPDVHDVLWDGFVETPRLIAAGAAATRAALPKIRAAIARHMPPSRPDSEPARSR